MTLRSSMSLMSVRRNLPVSCSPTSPGPSVAPTAPTACPPVSSVLSRLRASARNIFARLSAACEAKGFLCLKDGLRSRLAGIDVGFSMADFGVAASATCVVNTDSEEGRLAGMISEVSVIALKKSEIYPHLPAIAGKMRERMGTGSTPTYTTFITGPSRTADIERVSAIGVHGPLELHIVLLEA